jgi:hypothetical protein
MGDTYSWRDLDRNTGEVYPVGCMVEVTNVFETSKPFGFYPAFEPKTKGETE